jgi:hypothetical protein
MLTSHPCYVAANISRGAIGRQAEKFNAIKDKKLRQARFPQLSFNSRAFTPHLALFTQIQLFGM